MIKNKVIFIGPIQDNGGSGKKNQLLLERFQELFNEVVAIDTAQWRKRPWIIIQLLGTLFVNRKAKVVISASQNSRYLINFLYYFPIINKDIYCWIIGGAYPRLVKNGYYNLKMLKKLKKIIVEGNSMVIELNELGLNNVVHVPNFKPFYAIQKKQLKNKDFTKFVFLSRIHPDKGINEIIEACRWLNNNGYINKYSVDFYGPIHEGFNKDFETLINSCSNSNYKGFLNLTDFFGYEQLAQYDVMLFPTYWNGEGFPGIVIDAYIAGLPIIASDWNMNKEVIEDGKTGFIIPTHDAHSLAQKMKEIIDGQVDLYKMRCHCTERAQHYDYRNVVTEDLLKKLNLL